MSKNSAGDYTPLNEGSGFFWRKYTAIKKRGIVIYERIRHRKGRDTPDGGDAWWGDGGNDTIPPSPNPPKEGPSKTKRLVSRVSCVVGGILAWLVISQTAPRTQEPVSNALHALWVKQTSFDLQKTYETKHKDALAALVTANDETKKTKEELKKTKEMNEKVKSEEAKARDKIALLSTKLKQLEETTKKKIGRWRVDPNLKRLAERKQKVISAKLKKLLVLQGKKGALRSEWVPSYITNYAAYLQKQDRSIRLIDRKIKEQEGHRNEAKLAKAPSISHKKFKSWWKSALDKREMIRGSVSRILVAPHTPPVSWSKAGVLLPQPDSYESQALSLSVLANTHGATPSSSLLEPKVHLIVPLDGIYNIPLTKTQWVGVPWYGPSEIEGAKANQWVKIQEAIPTQSMPSISSPVPGANTQKPITVPPPEKKESAPMPAMGTPPQSMVQPQKTKESTSAPPVPQGPKESGINPGNITPEKLQLFLAKTNKTISSLPKGHPLKGTSFSMKPIKVKGVASFRVFIEREKKTIGYFTVSPGKKNNNYYYLISEPNILKLAEKKIAKEATKTKAREVKK